MRKAAAGAALLATAGAALLVAAGCARQVRVESGGGDSVPPDTVVGQVRQVGNTPFVRTILQTDSGGVQVAGPYENEVSRLVGARVRVVGEVDTTRSGAMGSVLRASSYTILSVDGDRPQVGVLRRSEAGYYLETGDGQEVPLSTVSSSLGAKVGAKVWVVTNDAGAVTRYGILKEP